jgi:hypothetical protein
MVNIRNIPKNGMLSLSKQGKTHINVDIQRELGITLPSRVPYLLSNSLLIIVDPKIKLSEAIQALQKIQEHLILYDKT